MRSPVYAVLREPVVDGRRLMTWYVSVFLHRAHYKLSGESIAITLLSHYTFFLHFFIALFNTIPADITAVLLGFAALNNVIVIIHALADP